MSVPPPTASSSVVYASPDSSHRAGPKRWPKKSREAKIRCRVNRPGSADCENALLARQRIGRATHSKRFGVIGEFSVGFNSVGTDAHYVACAARREAERRASAQNVNVAFAHPPLTDVGAPTIHRFSWSCDRPSL